MRIQIHLRTGGAWAEGQEAPLTIALIGGRSTEGARCAPLFLLKDVVFGLPVYPMTETLLVPPKRT